MVPRGTGPSTMPGVSLSRLWAFLAVALPVLASVIAPMSTVDLAYQLRAGDEILAGGAIPSVDTWTFTIAGRPWTDQQWLAQVLFHLVEAAGGWTGLVLFRALLTAATFAGVFGALLRSGLATRSAALLTLGALLVAAPAMAMRPQLLGMACFGMLLFLLASRKRHLGYRVAIVSVVVLWANVHGSFFLAPILVGLAWIDDLFRRRPQATATLLLLVAATLATFVTPCGPMVWSYALRLSADPEVTTRVSEWQPTSVREPIGLLFFASLLAVIAVLARSGQPIRWAGILALGGFAFLGLYAERGIAWWALMMPMIVVAALPSMDAARPAAAMGLRRVNLSLALAIGIGAALLLPWWRPLQVTEEVPLGVLEDAPLRLTEALQQLAEPGDRVLNPQLWGSWFEYQVPEVLVAIDSRIELYDADVLDAYDDILGGAPGWERHLADWGVDLVVVAGEDRALADRLGSAGWSNVFEGRDGFIFSPEPRVAVP